MSVAAIPGFPGHDDGDWAPVRTQVVAKWTAGHFAENLAVAADGAVLVSLHSHNRIDRYRPDTGELDVFCRLPAPVTGLAFDSHGTLWVTGGEPGVAPGYIWRVFQDAHVEPWVEIEDALFLNGCAILPDHIATHVAQTVLRLNPDGTRTTIAGPAEGAVGSTACAFGRAEPDRQALYVTTNGGLSLPHDDQLQDAKLLRLQVDENGEQLIAP